MDFAFFYAAALYLVLLFGGTVLGMIAFFRQDRMSRTIESLRGELAQLRSRLDGLGEGRQQMPPAAVPVAPVPVIEPKEAVTLSPMPPQIPIPAPSPGDATRGRLRWLEELAGGRLSVLLGGLALALGGVFLVRYTIEQGLLGPAGRIGLGAVFAAALAGAGEYLRQDDLKRLDTGAAKAYVPGALNGAAIVTAFATIYAAYALYGFIDASTAFVLLGLCSFTGLAISSIHGPGLAALGLAGSYATPLMVNGGRPDPWMLFAYLLAVTFACFFTAHLRRWIWLAITASVAADLWGLLWLVSQNNDRARWPDAVYIAALTACTILLLHRETSAETRAAPEPPTAFWQWADIDVPVSWLLAGHAVLALILSFADQLTAPSLWCLIALSLMLGGAAWTWRSLALAPAIAAITVVLSYVVSRDPLGPWWAAMGVDVPPVLPAATLGFLTTGALFGAGFGIAGLVAFLSRRANAVWPTISAAVPLFILVYAYWICTGFRPSIPFACIGGLLAVAFAYAAEYANRRPRSTLIDWGVALYAAAAVAALSLALAMVLNKGWLTVALALMAPGIALIHKARPIGILRWMIAGLALLLVGRLLTDPSIVGGDLGHLPIFNWLLYAYGIPVAAFWYSARLLLKERDDLPVQIAEGASIAFLAGLIGTEIRHYMTGGYVTVYSASLGEYGLHAMSWLGLSIGLRLRAGFDGGRTVPRYAALGFGGLGMASLLLNNLLLQNPVFTGTSVGGSLVLNDLLLAYGLPALLCGGLYYLLRRSPPRWVAWIPAAAALILAFAYVTFEVAHAFEGPVLDMGDIRASELYAYSVAWLAFALALLTAGIRLGSPILRQAAFGVLLLVTLKVFLVDLAGLSGLQQAGSFIGLGLALIGIGLAYQRLVLRAPQKEAPTE